MRRVTRRRFVRAAGVAGLVGVTGCTGDGGEDGDTSGDGETEDGTDTDTGATTEEGEINMGTILPLTGVLDAYGGGMQAAVDLAVQHVNDAGGPLGREITVSHKDSESSSTPAVQRYNELVNEDDIVGFVGAAGSGVSVPLAEEVANDGVMQVSPASTSPVLADLGWDGETKYFARTAPNDGQQGIVMGRILNEEEYLGVDRAAFLYINNPYGEGLAERASEAFDGETVAMVGYNEDTTDYTSTLDSVFDEDPEAVGFVGYPDNGVDIFEQWNNGGYGGQWVLSEGLQSQSEFIEPLGDVIDDMYITVPDTQGTDGAERFEEEFEREATAFTHNSYDSLFLMALAIERGGEASGEAMARNIRAVSGPPGEEITVGEFDRAREILDDGGEVNYQGASSLLDFNPNLEPLTPFSISQIQDGEVVSLESIPRDFFEGLLS